jgi:O-antigen/teichoic acid export membrane protein
VLRWERDVLREQIRLVAPLGLGSILNKANEFGRLVVGTVMGPVPLAIYSTAAYQVPLVNIVQTSLSDVIFPDLVKRAQRDPAEGLRLWKRAQMMVAAVILPACLLLNYFAEPLIRLAFTDAYVAATPTSRCSCCSWCDSFSRIRRCCAAWRTTPRLRPPAPSRWR